MKKILLLAGMLAAFYACQKDEMSTPDAAASSFTVTIPQSGVQTRAVTDAFGQGTLANRCILEIYHDGELYDRIEKGVSNKTVTFDNLRLVSSQTYDFVFWADCAGGSEG
ncbi:MAG: right-handed parallel beta-helix repeat-containing protein, partial [Alistipes communis]